MHRYLEHFVATFVDEPAELEWHCVVMTAGDPAPGPVLVSPAPISSLDMPARGPSNLERPAPVPALVSPAPIPELEAAACAALPVSVAVSVDSLISHSSDGCLAR